MSNAAEALTGNDAGAPWVFRFALETITVLMGPMMPHLAEELWAALGHATLLVDAPWPKADPALIVDDMVTVAVQVNGKLRGTVELAMDAAEEDVRNAALGIGNVRSFIDGRTVRKVIVVPNRIVNIVV